MSPADVSVLFVLPRPQCRLGGGSGGDWGGGWGSGNARITALDAIACGETIPAVLFLLISAPILGRRV